MLKCWKFWLHLNLWSLLDGRLLDRRALLWRNFGRRVASRWYYRRRSLLMLNLLLLVSGLAHERLVLDDILIWIDVLLHTWRDKIVLLDILWIHWGRRVAIRRPGRTRRLVTLPLSICRFLNLRFKYPTA